MEKQELNMTLKNKKSLQQEYDEVNVIIEIKSFSLIFILGKSIKTNGIERFSSGLCPTMQKDFKKIK